MALICPAFAGCGAVAYNVRAYRAHALEEPSLPIVLDRTDDLATSLELIDRILFETPYSVGDSWPDRIVLRDGRASSIRADAHISYPYSGTTSPVPLVKLYRLHLERELRATPVPAGDRPSLLGALASLSPQGRGLQTSWRAFSQLRSRLVQARSDKVALFDELSRPGRPPAPDDATRQRAAAESVARLERELSDLRSAIVEAALAAARTPNAASQRDAVLRDATSVLSVAHRLNLEAHALLPVVAVQAIGSVRGATHDLARHPSLKGLRQLGDLPSFVTSIESRIKAQAVYTRPMLEALAESRGLDADETPAFDLHESLVDQLVGITRDSFHVDARAGAEAFFFDHDVADRRRDDESTSSSSSETKVTKDFTGRSRRLVYQVKPIVLAAARFDVGFDAPHFPNAASLSLGYRTDRAFSSGGTLNTSTSLGRQLGVRGVASDIIDFSAGVFGVHTSARIARFTAGEVRTQQVDPATGNDTALLSEPVPLQLTFKQLDIAYDTTRFLGVGASLMGLESLLVGFRYYSYGLPRILYELEDVNTDPNIQDYRFVRESPPQPVLSRFYMGGLTLRAGGGPQRTLSGFLDTSMFFGGGPISYYFLTDASQPDSPANRDEVRKAAFGMTAGLGLGVRFRLVSPDSPLRIFAEARYQGDLVYSSVTISRAAVRQPDPDAPGVEVGTNRLVEFGGVDLFHGPRIGFVATF